MDAATFLKIIVCSLDKNKAQDIQVIEVGDITSMTEYFVIAAGGSSTQVRALADHVEEDLKAQGILPAHTEGYHSSTWLLADYGSVVLHIFQGETRRFYDLERLWKDGKPVDISEMMERSE